MEKVTLYVTQFEGALYVVQQEYPAMLSQSEVQTNLRDCLFHGLHKQLCDSMHYLYDDTRILYPQLVTAAHRAESEQGLKWGGHPSEIDSGKRERQYHKVG